MRTALLWYSVLPSWGDMEEGVHRQAATAETPREVGAAALVEAASRTAGGEGANPGDADDEQPSAESGIVDCVSHKNVVQLHR